MSFLGMDISKMSATFCLLSERPDDLLAYHRKAKLPSIKLSGEGISQILELPFHTAILEPTGMHYSKLWAHHLQKAGKKVLWVNHRVIHNYRESNRLPNKSDQADAIALAAYGIDYQGKPEWFIQLTGEEIRQLYLQLECINRDKSPILNQLRQQLVSEWPEIADTRSLREWQEADPPFLWRYLSGEPTQGRGKTIYDRKRKESIGLGISEFSQGLARSLCQLERLEYQIEEAIICEWQQAEYDRYHAVFDSWNIGPRTKAALLSRIYPIEKFLDSNGRPRTEYVIGENGKRSKRHRSLAAFKLSLGMGMVQSQSGQSLSWKPGGAEYARTALYRWIICSVLMGQKDNPKIQELQAIFNQSSGRKNHRVMKVAVKLVEALFWELVQQ